MLGELMKWLALDALLLELEESLEQNSAEQDRKEN